MKTIPNDEKTIDQKPIRLEVPQGEVKRFKITSKIADEIADEIEQGEFENSTGYYRATYKTVETGQNGDTASAKAVEITVDARRPNDKNARIADEGGDRNSEVVRIRVITNDHEQECILSIDLGNTRTVALLLDGVDNLNDAGIDGNNNINVYPVPMRWPQSPTNGGCVNGAFESIISLTDSTRREDSWCADDCRRSFAKLGEFAVFNNREAREKQDCHYTLSSPKRYFWDNDPVEKPWVAVRYPENKAPEVEELEHPIAQRLADAKGTTASHISPSSILQAMVIELYEQAVYYVSSEEFKNITHNSQKRRISKLHITYPSTLSPEEHKLYLNQLQSGLRAYGNDIDVELSSEIDEATSVLALYVFSEIKKYNNAKFWLDTIGRRYDEGSHARIAVIDIGGGTTDLSISTVSAYDSNASTNPSQASINPIHRDGINFAGDNFILNFLKKKVIDLGFNAVNKDLYRENGTESIDDLKDHYNKNKEIIKGLKRNFWFDLAIKIAVKCDELIKVHRDLDNIEKSNLDIPLSDEVRGCWKKLLETIKNSPNIEISGAEIQIAIDKDLCKAYQECIKSSFRIVAGSFAKAIYAFDADLVLFAGKTSEFYCVQDFFKKNIALNDMFIHSMKDFEVGNWCEGITDTDGKIADSKISTALGGALYTLRDAVKMDFELRSEARNSNYLWGIISDLKSLSFVDDLALFKRPSPEKLEITTTKNIFIARKRRYSRTAILSYQIRLKPNITKTKEIEGIATIDLTQRPDDQDMGLYISDCKGQYTDGSLLQKDDIECRICNMSNTFGLDDEKLF